MRPNWFLAFPIDGSFVTDLPALPPAFRRFHPEDVHLTLVFLGGCGEAAAERAMSALDRRLRETPLRPIEISLGEVTKMGAARAYTALSALLDRGRDEVVASIASLRDTLTESAHRRPDRRPPKPHVTIARPMRRATEAERAQGLRWAAELELGNVSARLDRIALYTWSQPRRERLFRIVLERRLDGVQARRPETHH